MRWLSDHAEVIVALSWEDGRVVVGGWWEDGRMIVG